MVRQALGDVGPAKRYIETVRGHGYRLIPAVSRAGRSGAAAAATTRLSAIYGGPFATLVKIMVVLALLMVIAFLATLLRIAK